MAKISPELKVGIFASLAAMVLGYMMFVLSPDSFTDQEYNVFHTVVSDASGVVVKSHVKTNGVVVGHVSDIILQDNSTRINLSINADVKIPVNSRVMIREKGLLGDVFIEIMRSKDTSEYARSGDFLAPSEGTLTLSKLMGLAGSIGQDLKKITSSLALALGGDVGDENVVSIVSDLRELAFEAKKTFKDNNENLKGLISSARKTMDALALAVDSQEGGADLRKIFVDLQQGIEDFRSFSSGMRTVLRKENRERIDTILARLDSAMGEVETISHDISKVSSKLDKGESTIGRLLNDDKTLEKIEGAVEDVRKLMAPVVDLETIVDAHSEVASSSQAFHYFNVQLRTRPDKHYVLGFVDVSERTVETLTEDLVADSEEVSADANNPVKTREKIFERKAIRFNLQFAKRWGPLQLRFGLFETTGGFASDLYLLDDRLRFTLEAYDWASDSLVRKTAHIKSYMSILFFKHVYALVGVDDLRRIDPKTQQIHQDPNWFLGAGLSFTDRDLKAIFSSAALAF